MATSSKPYMQTHPASQQPINKVSVVPPRTKYSYQKVAHPIKESNLEREYIGRNRANLIVRNTKPEIANQFYHAIQDKVPTMRVAAVKVTMNASIFLDEYLTQRFGMLPIMADVDEFVSVTDLNDLTEKNCITFSLKAECAQNEVVGRLITTADLVWEPLGEQKTTLKVTPRPLHKIKLFTLTPGQNVDIMLYCARGTGDIHAGWRPTTNVSYKPRPVIRMKKTIAGSDAEKVRDVCPRNVFDIEDTGKLIAARPLDCSMCRECLDADNTISLSHNMEEIHIGVQSRGVMSASHIVETALHYVNSLAESR